jgi:hypothetical protein
LFELRTHRAFDSTETTHAPAIAMIDASRPVLDQVLTGVIVQQPQDRATHVSV